MPVILVRELVVITGRAAGALVEFGLAGRRRVHNLDGGGSVAAAITAIAGDVTRPGRRIIATAIRRLTSVVRSTVPLRRIRRRAWWTWVRAWCVGRTVARSGEACRGASCHVGGLHRCDGVGAAHPSSSLQSRRVRINASRWCSRRGRREVYWRVVIIILFRYQFGNAFLRNGHSTKEVVESCLSRSRILQDVVNDT